MNLRQLYVSKSALVFVMTSVDVLTGSGLELELV